MLINLAIAALNNTLKDSPSHLEDKAVRLPHRVRLTMVELRTLRDAPTSVQSVFPNIFNDKSNIRLRTFAASKSRYMFRG